MTNNELFLDDFNLPNHLNELNVAEKYINIHKEKLDRYIKHNYITNTQFINLYEDIVKVLDYIGRLSMPAFEIESELENMYTKHYIKSPELAKKLWLDHYAKIHHPYSILKNRCFKLLDDIDNLYIDTYNCYPPNWKY